MDFSDLDKLQIAMALSPKGYVVTYLNKLFIQDLVEGKIEWKILHNQIERFYDELKKRGELT